MPAGLYVDKKIKSVTFSLFYLVLEFARLLLILWSPLLIPYI